MEKIKKVILSPLFVSGATAIIGIALIAESHPLYAGIAFGIGIAKFLEAFKAQV
jgi:uncharacterized membrane protein